MVTNFIESSVGRVRGGAAAPLPKPLLRSRSETT